jgi:hypothetical protein
LILVKIHDGLPGYEISLDRKQEPDMTKHEIKQGGSPFAMPMFSEIGNIPNVLGQSAEAYQQTLLECQQECSNFVADRVQQDMEAFQALAQSRTFPELLKIQQEWFSSALHDYTTESQKFMERAGRLMSAGFTPARKPREKAEGPKAA